MLKWEIVCWALGVWAAVSFVMCVAWGLVMPEALPVAAAKSATRPGDGP